FFSTGTLLVPAVFNCSNKNRPNDKINIACIGLGSHGIQHNLKNYLQLCATLVVFRERILSVESHL
ncbi:MAG: hypothetical protein KAJ19_14730, partial [Gammaproteobacteria bacterium]|nr:hypothetical protein [Gammaproteobacteria bacterium]